MGITSFTPDRHCVQNCDSGDIIASQLPVVKGGKPTFSVFPVQPLLQRDQRGQQQHGQRNQIFERPVDQAGQ
jgi:hypothetical protein